MYTFNITARRLQIIQGSSLQGFTGVICVACIQNFVAKNIQHSTKGQLGQRFCTPYILYLLNSKQAPIFFLNDYSAWREVGILRFEKYKMTILSLFVAISEWGGWAAASAAAFSTWQQVVLRSVKLVCNQTLLKWLVQCQLEPDPMCPKSTLWGLMSTLSPAFSSAFYPGQDCGPAVRTPIKDYP